MFPRSASTSSISLIVSLSSFIKATRYFSFAVAEQFTGVPGTMVSIEDTIKGFKMILDGEVDYLPEPAFLNVGTIEEAIEKGKKLLEQAGGKTIKN